MATDIKTLNIQEVCDAITVVGIQIVPNCTSNGLLKITTVTDLLVIKGKPSFVFGKDVDCLNPATT